MLQVNDIVRVKKEIVLGPIDYGVGLDYDILYIVLEVFDSCARIKHPKTKKHLIVHASHFELAKKHKISGFTINLDDDE